MTVYEAIEKMRQMSEREEEFSFSFMSYSLTRDESHGEVFVEHAILYKRSKGSKGSKEMGYQDYMLTFLNTDTGEVRQFWQPLLMTFQHKPLKIEH